MNLLMYAYILLQICTSLFPMEMDEKFTSVKLKRRNISHNNQSQSERQLLPLSIKSTTAPSNDNAKKLNRPTVDKRFASSAPNIRTEIQPIQTPPPVRLQNVIKETQTTKSADAAMSRQKKKKLKKLINTLHREESFTSLQRKIAQSPVCLNQDIPHLISPNETAIIYFLKRLCDNLHSTNHVNMWHTILEHGHLYSKHTQKLYATLDTAVNKAKENYKKKKNAVQLIANTTSLIESFRENIKEKIEGNKELANKGNDALLLQQKSDREDNLRDQYLSLKAVFNQVQKDPNYTQQLGEARINLNNAWNEETMSKKQLLEENDNLEAREKDIKNFREIGYKLLFSIDFYNSISKRMTPIIREWIAENIKKDTYLKEWYALCNEYDNEKNSEIKQELLKKTALLDRWHQLINPQEKPAFIDSSSSEEEHEDKLGNQYLSLKPVLNQMTKNYSYAQQIGANDNHEAAEKDIENFKKNGYKLLFSIDFYNLISKQMTPIIREWIAENIKKDTYLKEWHALYDRYNLTKDNSEKENEMLSLIALNDRWHTLINPEEKYTSFRKESESE